MCPTGFRFSHSLLGGVCVLLLSSIPMLLSVDTKLEKNETEGKTRDCKAETLADLVAFLLVARSED